MCVSLITFLLPGCSFWTPDSYPFFLFLRGGPPFSQGCSEPIRRPPGFWVADAPLKPPPQAAAEAAKLEPPGGTREDLVSRCEANEPKSPVVFLMLLRSFGVVLCSFSSKENTSCRLRGLLDPLQSEVLKVSKKGTPTNEGRFPLFGPVFRWFANLQSFRSETALVSRGPSMVSCISSNS